MAIDNVDGVEINETFAAQVIPSPRGSALTVQRQAQLYGGALALGRPFDMTGVRILSRLLTACTPAMRQ
jgi:acetyl-CoA acetyltransferase